MSSPEAPSRPTPEQLRALRRRAQAIPSQPRDGRRFPAAFAQQRLWFLNRLGDAAGAYNVPQAVALTGPLDVAALRWALDRVVARHEALRTTFEDIDGMPHQRIAAPHPFALVPRDLRDLDAEAAEIALAAALEEEASTPFDPMLGPLARGRLVRLADERHVLLLTMHHIVSDGWSLAVLARELEALYSARVRGEADPLPPLPVQYADYAVWQRERLSGARLEQEGRWWREALAGAPPRLELPTDRRRPQVQSHAGALCEVRIAPDLVASLKTLTQRHGATLFMTLFAGWAAVLSRLSGQTDLVVGTPVANRGRREVQALIGFFVNTLPIRVDLGDDPDTPTLLARVRTQVLAAQEHGELPFEQIVEQVNPERSLAWTPIFQTSFAWHNTAPADLRFEGLEARPLQTPHAVSKFDLSLSLAEEDEAIVGTLEYATALFDAATVRRFADYLLAALHGMVEDPSRPVGALPLIGDEERRSLIHDRNATDRDFGPWRPFHVWIEDHAAAAPDAEAVTCGDDRLDYAAFNAGANRLAHWLRDRGIGRGDRVALCVQRSVRAVEAIFAIMKAGAAYVPIDPAYPTARIAMTLADARPALVLDDPASRHALDAALAQLAAQGETAVPETIDIERDRARWADAPSTNPDPAAVGLQPDDAPYIIYTSGSTGVPKGVVARHAGVSGLAHALREPFGLTPRTRVLQFASFSFDAFVLEWTMAFGAGGSLHLAAPGETLIGETLEALVAERGATHALIPPVVLATMPESASLATLHTLACGGETVPPALLRRWNRNRRFINVYGPTETTAISTAYVCPADMVEADTVPIGGPLANERVYILDRRLQPVPTGAIGELCIGGIGVASGYLHRPALTAERFVDSPFVAGDRLYRSGDLARWRADGTLEHLGRNDFQVKIRGFRIELGEIEAKLAAQPGVKEAAVLAREDVPGEKQLVAYCLETAPGKIAPEALRVAMQAQLPAYMVPSAIVPMSAWPTTVNGKLDRAALPAPESPTVAERPYLAPRTPIEEVLAIIWAEVLGVERVGVEDDFFDLGGHSLMAMRLTAAIRETLGIEVPLKIFFEAPTVARMARALLPED
ncbi:MAG: non-ribosomal peptide synthetase [Pseudomonadota bacterium]